MNDFGTRIKAFVTKIERSGRKLEEIGGNGRKKEPPPTTTTTKLVYLYLYLF